MMLHPLSEVGIGVLMAIVVGRSQLVMDILRHGEGGEPKKNTDHPQGHSRTEQAQKASELNWQRHHGVRRKHESDFASGTKASRR